MILREEICLIFFFGRGIAGVVDEDGFLPMKKNVSRFMKETEPEMIVGPVAQAELDHHLLRPEPFCGAAKARAVKLRQPEHDDTRPAAQLLQGGVKLFGRHTGQCPDVVQRRFEPVPVEGGNVQRFGMLLSPAEPGSDRIGAALKGLRGSERHSLLFLEVNILPGVSIRHAEKIKNIFDDRLPGIADEAEAQPRGIASAAVRR